MDHRWLFIVAVLPATVYSLSCYICGDGNLDEFGECSTQFQYDCQSYAARFSPDEPIFCRTTRHKAPNNTYTIMKECISEQDHYHNFPNKGYPIDEECDLVEVRGEEVAYCLCRNHNLCNKPPIADQFIAFEEKNPELFGDVDPPSSHSVPKGHAPLALAVPSVPSHAFVAPPIPPPPIVPINDPRNRVPGIESEIRRAQLPTRERSSEDGASAGGSIPFPEYLNEFHLARSSPSQGKFIGSMESNRHAAAAVPAPPATFPKAPQPARTASVRTAAGGPSSMLKCAQCGQTDLKSEDADCDRQLTVQCSDPDSVCFTRQILLGAAQAAVEKMCVSWQAVKQEFPMATLDTCGDTSQGRVRYCTCSTNECNSPAITLQMVKEFATDPLPPLVRTNPSGRLPHLAAPELPLMAPAPPAFPAKLPELQPPVIAAVPAIHPVHKEPPSLSAAMSEEKLAVHEPAPPPIEPIVHHGGGFKPEIHTENNRHEQAVVAQIPEVAEPSTPQKASLRCSACLETGITDPIADCSTSAPATCSSHEEYCLTRQTQNDQATFTMEKRCISEAMVASFIKSSDVKVGCAIAEGGLINYCLCQNDLCNSDSILAQAQISGVRKSEHPTKPLMAPAQPTVTKVEPPKPPSNPPPVVLDSSEVAENVVTTETRFADEDRELQERQKQWGDEDLSASVQPLVLPAVLLTGILLL
ncbi:hypothetical protein Q1695_011042 [Nippostrongylus brasiliensis]|nr:hypothetical protein Q1695_011042 [Nippostrongylus brasiliensis]